MGDGFLSIWLVAVIFYLFLGISVLMDIFMESIHEITSSTEEVEIQWRGTDKVVKVDVPRWNEQVANVTLIALGSSAPEIFLCCFSILKDVESPPNPIGPMVLVGSAAFNMLVVTGISILAAVEIKRLEKFGAFVVTAIFACFAYIWFYIVLCVSTPGYISFWEAFTTLALYFILVLCVFVS
jgi:Ca2+/Na+ antiporter